MTGLHMNYQIKEISPSQLTRKQVGRMFDIFVEAFCNEPMFVYMFADEKKRKKQIRWSVERKWTLMSPRYTVWAAFDGEDIAGFSWWFKPGAQIASSIKDQLMAGYAWAPVIFGLSTFRRMYQCGNHEQQSLARLTDERFWLLDVIAVDPGIARRGLGGRLIEGVFRLADSESAPVWVITHNTRNTLFYQKNQFQKSFEEPVIANGPVAYAMRRPPSE